MAASQAATPVGLRGEALKEGLVASREINPKYYKL